LYCCFDGKTIQLYKTKKNNKANKLAKICMGTARHKDGGKAKGKTKGKAEKPRGSRGRAATDARERFIAVFREGRHPAGKRYPMGAKGNSHRPGHRARRAFQWTCCFSKKLADYPKTFDMVFFYINYGFV
jgi:hypothetical protein